MEKRDDIVEIDLLRLAKALWQRAVVIVLVMVLAAMAAFGVTKLFITPEYQASVVMYVNSSSSQTGDKTSISQAELTTAQKLVDTYTVILETRSTLGNVIEKAEVDYTYDQLLKMIKADSVDGTELFKIVVTSTDPQEAMVLANTIAEVLPEKISAIVEGSSTRVVDYAVVPTQPSAPSTMKNVVIGAFIGAVLVCAVIIVKELLDDKIHGEDYLTQTYELPLLAVIPDLLENSKKSYGYHQEPAKRVR